MPQLVICYKCSAVLFESAEELKSTEEIVQGHDGRCPTCHKKLSYIPRKIEVNFVEGRIGSLVPEKRKLTKKKGLKNTQKPQTKE